MTEHIRKKPNQIILIGGGYSIKEGIEKDLWNKIKYSFAIGINYSFKWFKSTINIFVDHLFYEETKEQIKSLSLIIGKKYGQLKPLPNTILLPSNDSVYTRDLKQGVWRAMLSGVFGVSLGIYLLDVGEIFLLGYDGRGKIEGNKIVTHFYQDEFTHRGTSQTGYYDIAQKADEDYGVYKNEKNVLIYNVSLDSRINIFPKISYDKFFEMLDKEKYCQDWLVAYTRSKISHIYDK